MLKRKLRVAGVGAGHYARFHLDAWMANERVDYVGICDADPAKAEAFAHRFGIPRTFANAGDMLDALKPELVDIVTPPASHLALALAAFERGITVVCQKPLAPTYDEAVQLVALAEQHQTGFFVHENFRFRPWFREAEKLIRGKSLGTIHSLAFRLRPGDGQGKDAYLDRQPYFQGMPRFLIHETVIHFIDTFRYLLGEITAVTAQLRRLNPVIAGEDAGYVIFEFAGGPTALFDGNRLNAHAADNPMLTMGEMWLEGSAGVLRLDGQARLWWAPHGGPETEHHYDRGEKMYAGGSVRALKDKLVEHLLDGTAMENSGRDYLKNLRIEEAVYQSHQENRRITIDGA